ncbi:glycosyltransferase [Bosea sp. FBZP-16]|uniref:glycosyltransferase family 2 protein n=1 Tax=Bosea sp. FBZP-16 TaxID=2065382 RepID=UPI001319D88F|nr:glycosyltransferase [Bosea sp. FBZP-16]
MEALAWPRADASAVRMLGLPAEIAFLADHGVPPAELREAARLAERIGVSPSRQVIASGLVEEEEFYRALAAELDLRFQPHAPPLQRGGDVAAILREGLAATRVRPESPLRFAAAPPPGPALRRFLSAGARAREDIVVLPPAALAVELRRTNAGPITRAAAWLDEAGLRRFSARTGSSWLQKGFACLMVGLLSWFGTLAPLATLTGLGLMLGPLFFGAVILRFAALAEKPAADLWRDHRWQIDDSRLPVYTVAVPIFGEEAVLDQLIQALAALDYPAAKLDIHILVEEIDWNLRRALATRTLPPFMQVTIVPRGQPQTKPRALNIALAEARGELFAIFDAEDIPDPRQLRLAAARFLRSDDDLVCLQAHLVIDNPEDSWLSGCFALEYAGLFDVLNPGLLAAGLPIMLGGTSNHFRTQALRRVGGWDPWNVTEDADIGFRLVRAGGYMADLPSHTLEEAPRDLQAWLKQRRRWLKGYLQTLISHMQRPDRLVREAGVGATLTFLVLTLGTLLGTLLLPFLVVMTGVAILRGSLLSPSTPLDMCFSALSLGLAGCGLLTMFLVPALGAKRRGAPDLWRRLWLLPLYHLVTSLAGWLALYDYVDDRFGWHKTAHGLARSSRYRGPASSGRAARPGELTDAAATPAPPLPAGARY